VFKTGIAPLLFYLPPGLASRICHFFYLTPLIPLSLIVSKERGKNEREAAPP
jgi:hypothetical protein